MSKEPQATNVNHYHTLQGIPDHSYPLFEHIHCHALSIIINYQSLLTLIEPLSSIVNHCSHG